MIEPRPQGRSRKNGELVFLIVVASFIVTLTSSSLLDNLDGSFLSPSGWAFSIP